jgi:hypothetical protein
MTEAVIHDEDAKREMRARKEKERYRQYYLARREIKLETYRVRRPITQQLYRERSEARWQCGCSDRPIREVSKLAHLGTAKHRRWEEAQRHGARQVDGV